jgi:hypothetical protein
MNLGFSCYFCLMIEGSEAQKPTDPTDPDLDLDPQQWLAPVLRIWIRTKP